MKCEKCGQKGWGTDMMSTRPLNLVGGCMAELCLPCQREWVVLVKSDSNTKDFELALATKELMVAEAHSKTFDSSVTNSKFKALVLELYKIECYFTDLSIKWLAEKPKAENLKT